MAEFVALNISWISMLGTFMVSVFRLFLFSFYFLALKGVKT